MKNRRFVLSLILSITVQAAFGQDAAVVVKNLLEGHQQIDLKSLPAADKPALLLELKKYARQENGHGSYTRQATIELVRLGDHDAIEQQVTAFLTASSLRKARTAADMLAQSSDASVIPRIANELFKEESAAEAHDKVSFEYPKSVLASKIAWGIGASSTQFTENVRQAMQALERIEVADRRAILRNWYTANEPLFAQGNYAAVSPPR